MIFLLKKGGNYTLTFSYQNTSEEMDAKKELLLQDLIKLVDEFGDDVMSAGDRGDAQECYMALLKKYWYPHQDFIKSVREKQ